MAMSERELIKQAYPYLRWYRKVDRMSDAQVHVLFIRFKNEKKI